MHMMRKGQIEGIGRKHALSQKKVYREPVWGSSLREGERRQNRPFFHEKHFLH